MNEAERELDYVFLSPYVCTRTLLAIERTFFVSTFYSGPQILYLLKSACSSIHFCETFTGSEKEHVHNRKVTVIFWFVLLISSVLETMTPPNTLMQFSQSSRKLTIQRTWKGQDCKTPFPFKLKELQFICTHQLQL